MADSIKTILDPKLTEKEVNNYVESAYKQLHETIDQEKGTHMALTILQPIVAELGKSQ